MTASETRDVEELMDRYFDGLYRSDSGVLLTVFHADLAYVNATEGNHEVMDLDAYMTRIDNRRSPAARGEPRSGSIDRMTLFGGQMGVVEARVTMIGRDYQDLLSLVRTDDGWKVIAKVFAYQGMES